MIIRGRFASGLIILAEIYIEVINSLQFLPQWVTIALPYIEPHSDAKATQKTDRIHRPTQRYEEASW